MKKRHCHDGKTALLPHVEEKLNILIGSRIRYARKRAKLTQAQLAKMAGMSRSSIVRYEAGRRKITDEAASRIAGALGMTGAILLYPT